MQIELIDYGYNNAPKRAHPNDAGADVYAVRDIIINTRCAVTEGLGFGIKVPAGFAAFIFPRSSLAKKGIDCFLPPIDPDYTGEVHAFLYNSSTTDFHIKAGERIGQLVLLPAITPEFVVSAGEKRGLGAFGSTGK